MIHALRDLLPTLQQHIDKDGVQYFSQPLRINGDTIEPHDGPSSTRKIPKAQFFAKQDGTKWDIEFDFANQTSMLHPPKNNP